MKILIVEDNPDIIDSLSESFKSEGYIVDTALDGHRGSYLARTSKYDFIILDYSLPHKDGLIVCSEIRTLGVMTPIIFLSVLDDPRLKISALEMGADDYLTKPFSYEELKARIKAISRRPRKIESHLLTIGELTIDTEKQVAFRKKEPIYLTRKEYCLLEFLMKNPGVVLSRGAIFEHVWNAGSDPFSNTVEAHILNLRKKINQGNPNELIRNVPGRGYIIGL